MAFQLPPLPNAQLFDEQGRPTAIMQQYWQQLTQALTGALQTLADVTNTVLPSFQQAIAAANKAASDANAAAAAASQAAQAAMDAQQQASKEQSLTNSYIDPASVLTATPALITVADHTRYYTDGSHVAVTGGTVPASGQGDTDYVTYFDAQHTGGVVQYQASTVQPSQINGTHVVGAVTIPATGTANGGAGPQKPGYVDPN